MINPLFPPFRMLFSRPDSREKRYFLKAGWQKLLPVRASSGLDGLFIFTQIPVCRTHMHQQPVNIDIHIQCSQRANELFIVPLLFIQPQITMPDGLVLHFVGNSQESWRVPKFELLQGKRFLTGLQVDASFFSSKFPRKVLPGCSLRKNSHEYLPKPGYALVWSRIRSF